MTQTFNTSGDPANGEPGEETGAGTTEGGSFGGDTHSDEELNSLSREELEKLIKRDRNAQEHIRRLETERKEDRRRIEEYERQLEQARTFDDLLERIQSTSNTYDDDTTNNRPVDVEQLVSAAERKVMESLTQRERASREEENFNKAVNELKSSYGDDFAKRVQERADQLGLPIEEMDRLAKTSPSALVELVRGSQGNASNTPRPSHGSVNTSIASRQDQGSLDDFEKVRAENPRLFYSPEFQGRYNKAILDKARKEGRIN